MNWRKLRNEERTVIIPTGVVTVPPEMQIKLPKEEDSGSKKEEGEQEEGSGESRSD